MLSDCHFQTDNTSALPPWPNFMLCVTMTMLKTFNGPLLHFWETWYDTKRMSRTHLRPSRLCRRRGSCRARRSCWWRRRRSHSCGPVLTGRRWRQQCAGWCTHRRPLSWFRRQAPAEGSQGSMLGGSIRGSVILFNPSKFNVGLKFRGDDSWLTKRSNFKFNVGSNFSGDDSWLTERSKFSEGM